MGFAMLKGWLDSAAPSTITVLDPHHNPTTRLNAPLFDYASNFDDILNLKKSFDIIALAIKPQNFDEIKITLSNLVTPSTVLLSIMAGVQTSQLADVCTKNQPKVVRAMPNLPALIGAGITACYAPQNTDKELVDQLLHPLGAVVWVEQEADMDAVTALSGSGPAYLFHFVEVLSESGVKLGLSPSLSAQLARQTVLGASLMLQDEPHIDPLQFRQQVTSKGGTTEAALEILTNPETGLKPLMEKALHAAAARSKELSRAK